MVEHFYFRLHFWKSNSMKNLNQEKGLIQKNSPAVLPGYPFEQTMKQQTIILTFTQHFSQLIPWSAVVGFNTFLIEYFLGHSASRTASATGDYHLALFL